MAGQMLSADRLQHHIDWPKHSEIFSQFTPVVIIKMYTKLAINPHSYSFKRFLVVIRKFIYSVHRYIIHLAKIHFNNDFDKYFIALSLFLVHFKNNFREIRTFLWGSLDVILLRHCNWHYNTLLLLKVNIMQLYS